MGEIADGLYGIYRCPVCGHRDDAVLADHEASCLIACSYCEAALEVSARGPDSVRLVAQLAGTAVK